MARLRPQILLDRDGAILFQGIAPTLKSYVESLVRDGQSLARVDLRTRDLAGLDLDGAILDDAILDGADLRGTTMRRCSAVSASFRGIAAHGMNAERGRFQGADFGPLEKRVTKLNGVRMAFCNFDGAIFNEAICDEGGFSRAHLTRVLAHRASFRNARMLDTEFAFSNWTACNFDEAKMASSTKIAKEHQPDRTMGASAISCTYKGAQRDTTTPAFARDRYWTTTLSALAYIAASGAVVAATHGLHLEGEENPLMRLLHDTTTFVAVTGGALMLGDWVSETLRDKMKEGFDCVELALRKGYDGLIRMGANAHQLITASVRGPGRKALKEALRATKSEGDKRGFFSDFWSNKPTSVIFCDRRHLALALETLCAGRTRHRLNGDVVLVRKDTENAAIPSLIRYRTDGGTSLAWTKEGNLVGTADYTRGGDLVHQTGNIEPEFRINRAMSAFETELMREHHVDLTYDGKNHDIRAGRDGSIIVVQQGHRRPDNAEGPALLTPSGDRRFFHNGVEDIEKADFDDGDESTVIAAP